MLTLDQRKEAARALLLIAFDCNRSVADKREALSRLMDAQGYIQHSPGLENGLESLLALIAGFDRDFPGYAITVERMIAEGDLVFAHCHYTYGSADPHGKAIAEIFRFEDDRIVEHWDVIQDVPSQSRNPNGMF